MGYPLAQAVMASLISYHALHLLMLVVPVIVEEAEFLISKLLSMNLYLCYQLILF